METHKLASESRNLDPSAPADFSDSAGGASALALAVFLGVAGVVFIAFYTHWYETVILRMPEERQLAPTSVTPIVFCLMFILLLTLNPLLRRFAPAMHLRRRELLVVLAMWLVAGVVTYASFINGYLVNAGILFGPALSGEQTRVDLRDHLPTDLFLSADQSREFYYGLSDGMTRVPFRAVPWAQWIGPLSFWVPLMLVVLVISSCLIQVVHRQWSKHELLPYPIAGVADSFLAQRPREALPAIFHSKGFWAGFVIVGFIYLVNGLNAWFPNVPKIPLSYWHGDLLREFPFLQRGSTYAFTLLRGLVHPYMVAIAVLLPAEFSLTCWLGWVLLIVGASAHYTLTGDVLLETQSSCAQWGMIAGVIGFILYVGWREYGRILRCAVTGRPGGDPAIRKAAAAFRVFLIAFAALVGLLIYAGLDWLLALFLAGSFAVMVIIMGRVTAEIGMPCLYSFMGMAHFLPMQTLGPAAVGVKGMALLAMVGGMLDIFPGNTLPANETTYRKLEEDTPRRLSSGRFNLVLVLAAVTGIGAAVVAHLWDDYSYGANRESVMRTYLRNTVRTTTSDIGRLQLADSTTGLDQVSGLSKLKLARAQAGFWRYFIYGAALIGGCAFMRLRFSWWPFHPLPLLFLNTHILSRLYLSFFLGWAIKIGLTRIGGGQVFSRSKPFFFGVIAGQVVVSCLWLFIGGIYYAVTGRTPPANLIGFII